MTTTANGDLAAEDTDVMAAVDTTDDAAAQRAAEVKELSELHLALAGHFTQHPDLCPCNLIFPGRLQLRDIAPNYGAELIRWADTLDEPRVEIKRISERAYTYVHGRLGDHDVTVWEVVSRLAHDMGSDAFDDNERTWITVDALRAYVDHGIAPRPWDPS